MKTRKTKKIKSLALASDHQGIKLKTAITSFLKKLGLKVIDLGPYVEESVDYPDFAKKLVKNILSGKSQAGILICGSGIGMSIAANRYKKIRAALCYDKEAAEMTRKHNDANVLVLAGKRTNVKQAIEITKAFLNTEFEGGRHLRRIRKIDSI